MVRKKNAQQFRMHCLFNLLNSAHFQKVYKNLFRIAQSEQDGAPGIALSLSVIQCDLILLGPIHI